MKKGPGMGVIKTSRQNRFFLKSVARSPLPDQTRTQSGSRLFDLGKVWENFAEAEGAENISGLS